MEPPCKQPRISAQSTPKDVSELVTPCYIGYKSVIQRNSERMLQRAKQLGCQLRPHMKTHKTIQGGVLATDGTKRCITVSTLAEAEFYADAGFEDICYAVPITAEKLPRAAQLHERCLFHVCVDHPQAVEALCQSKANKPWSVFLMVDCGYGRDGVDVKDPTSVQLAQRLASSKGTRLAGLYTHGGHSYDASQGIEAVRAVAQQEAEAVAAFARTLRGKPYCLEVPIVGVGSTPTCSNPPNQFPSEVTEMHPGNYIYYDTMQQALGSCSEEDIAVRVLTRVIGAYERRNLLLVDMGWTACSKQGEDQNFGRLEGHPELKVVGLKQEAGLISSRDGSPIDFAQFPLGTLLRLEPYHSCAHTKQHDKIYILDEDRCTVLHTWPICRRGFTSEAARRGAALVGQENNDRSPPRRWVWLWPVLLAGLAVLWMTSKLPALTTSSNTSLLMESNDLPSTSETTTAVTREMTTFYMYRAQSDNDYDFQNVNAANLAGVMWYLEHEVVFAQCPRHYNITRILRYKVSMKTPEKFNHNFSQFWAYDKGMCTSPACGGDYAQHGFNVGCQYEVVSVYPGAVWYSLPGECPTTPLVAKGKHCKHLMPGGRCDRPTGEKNCTWSAQKAGAIEISELEGIYNWTDFCKQHGNEYILPFWDGRGDAVHMKKRLRKVLELFHSKYPDEPVDLEDREGGGDVRPKTMTPYNTFPEADDEKAILPLAPGKQRRMNLNALAIAVNLLLPWCVFCFVCCTLSFSWHYQAPMLAWSTVLLGLMLAAFTAKLAACSEETDPKWYAFFSFAIAAAVLAAAACGEFNYRTYNVAAYDLKNMNAYPDVNPATKGQQLMDAGRLYFVDGSALDLKKAMSFKNDDTYCVAPIILGKDQMASYDFWAVGVNCCPGQSPDFRCGEYNNAHARAGLRLMSDVERPFYRLAVQQAEAAYNIRTEHPMFFHWVQDPVADPPPAEQRRPVVRARVAP
ncbi:unnamed protein product [Durusdinium trenchii]|uniref:D-serine dehydratase-like domain-containing protein n=1 Tax=Durusdinium trenchii TaxID=1381693 RepID=A0ABP0QHR4_9DINO